jgi:WXG100 family type VII secretion target
MVEVMQFTVTPAELHSAAKTCQNTNQQIQGQISQMQNYVLGLMGSYEGTAALALQHLSDQWGADAKSLNVVLSTIADGLTFNANNYVTSEAGNATNLMNIVSGLPNAKF